jgi:hypothetical protein
MATSILDRRTQPGITEPDSGTVSNEFVWQGLYTVAALSAGLMLMIIPAAVAVYLIWPPPFGEDAQAWFSLYQESWLRGLLGLDLLFLLSNVLMIPLYVALFVALRKANESLMALALSLGFVGLGSYFSSNTAFQMLSLSNRYESATTDAERAALLAAGESMMATFEGTAFNVYYVLSAIALVLIAVVMLRSAVFGTWTAYIGLFAGLMMAVPATAGMPGLIFSMLSLIPWMIFLVLIGWSFFQMSRECRDLTRMEAT